MSQQSAEVDDAVGRVRAALEAGDRDGLRAALHPYLHWTQDGTTTRGRTKVLALLEPGAAAAPPESVELRDGQVYRWTVGRESGR